LTARNAAGFKSSVVFTVGAWQRRDGISSSLPLLGCQRCPPQSAITHPYPIKSTRPSYLNPPTTKRV
jgi:hypothetical protein